MQQLLSMLMSLILMILSLFGGTGDITKKDDADDAQTTVEYNYTINSTYYEFKDAQYGESNKRNLFNLYIPRTNTSCNMGLILYIHGGAWVGGDRDGIYWDIQSYALANGYAYAAMTYDYLSADTDMSVLLDDITDAITAIQTAGKQVAVNFKQVMLVGYSAGGQLALVYSYSRADESPIEPVAVVSYAGAADLTDEGYWTTATDVKDNYTDVVPADGAGMNLLQYILSRAVGETIMSYDDVETYEDELLTYSAKTYCKTAIPTLLVHGKKDITVPYSTSETLNAYLDHYAANVEHFFVTLDNSGHELSNSADADKIEEAYEDFDFLAYKYLTSVADLMVK